MRLKAANTLADVPARYKLAAAAAKGLGWPIQLRCTAGMQRTPTADEYELWAQPPGEAWMHFYPHQSLTHAVKLMDAMKVSVEIDGECVTTFISSGEYLESVDVKIELGAYDRTDEPMRDICRAIMFAAAAMRAPDEFVFHAPEEH